MSFGNTCFGFFGGGGSGGGGGGGNNNAVLFTVVADGNSFTYAPMANKTLYGILTDGQGYNPDQFNKPLASGVCTRTDGGSFTIGQTLLLFISV